MNIEGITNQCGMNLIYGFSSEMSTYSKGIMKSTLRKWGSEHKKGTGMYIATTASYQISAEEVLTELGFKSSKSVNNPNSGNLITLWWITPTDLINSKDKVTKKTLTNINIKV